MFLKKNFHLGQVVEFTLNKIKRDDIVEYPDDINKSFKIDLGFGGYKEKRSFYEKSNQIIHLGMDVFLPYKEKLYMPFSGFLSDIIYIYNKKYQVGKGSGTQVVIWHSFDEIAFVLGQKKTKQIFGNKKYLKIIYIHLDIDYFSKKLKIKFDKKKHNNNIIKYYQYNKKINKGDIFAQIGSRFNNGGWAPHVHIETFLKDEIEKIDYSQIEDIYKKSSIGIIEDKKRTLINEFNLIDPNLIFNLKKYRTKKEAMSISCMKNEKDLIQIKNLSVSYDKKVNVINNISLNIKKGELISLLGPSGCGKTTFLNAISGFISFDGTIDIKGIEDISDIGYVFQNNIIYNNISIFQNIYLSAKNNFKYKIETYFDIWNSHKLKNNDKDEFLNIKSLYYLYIKKVIKKPLFLFRFNSFKNYFNKKYFKINFQNILKKDIHNILEILDISNISHKKSSQISGGQKQRVAIAKAIIKKPILLIMDEPLSSLDAQIKHKTRNWIKNLQRKFKITLIFVTHDQNDAMLIADRVLIINKGEIQQFDTPNNIFHKPKNEFVAKFVGWPEINLIKKTKKQNYYLRPENIKIDESKIKNSLIIDKQILGERFIYVCLLKNKKINIISKKEYYINDKINISWNVKYLKKFTIENESKN